MKRSVALILAALMVVAMLPASLLPALAHGTGVGMNSIDNLSIDNAPDQLIPATVNVDGKSDDTAWAYEDWKKVDSTTGMWDVTTSRNPGFGYKYQLHTDYEYLYGVFVIDTNGVFSGNVGEITVWLNDSGADKYTDKIVLTVSGEGDAAAVECTRYDANGNLLGEPEGALPIDALLKDVTEADGVYTVEFRTLITAVAPTADTELKSYVSVELTDGSFSESLYYPRFSVDDSITVDPATTWPTNAVAITEWEILSSNQNGAWGSKNGDYSEILPSEIHVDGEFDEAVWLNFTDFYTTGGSKYDYRENSDGEFDYLDLSVGYSNTIYYYDYEDGIVNTKLESGRNDDPVSFSNGAVVQADNENWKYDTNYVDWAGAPVKFKYDVRADKDYFYGAIVAYIDCENEDFYYYLRSQGDAKKDGETRILPTYLHLAVPYYSASEPSEAATTIQVKYNTEVKWSEAKQKWMFNNEFGEGHNEVEFCKTTYGKYTDWISAKRTSRYLINFEFRIPLEEIGVKSGDKYLNDARTAFDADSYDILHTVIINNTPYTYGKEIGDGGTAAVDKTITYTDSDGTGTGVKVTTDYTGGFDAGYYTYHAWSYGQGTNASNPVVASVDKNAIAKDITINGDLEDVWANLYAADSKVNSMLRGANTPQDDDVKVSTNTAGVTTDIVTTYYHELVMDNEYLYGAALIINGDSDGWTMYGTTTDDSGNTVKYGDVFRLWINTGVGNWEEEYNYYLNFYIEDGTYIPVCDVGKNNAADVNNSWSNGNQWQNAVFATSKSNSEYNPKDGIVDTAEQIAGYGIEVSMKVVDGYTLRDVEHTVKEGGFESVTVPLVALEFRVPLSLIGVSTVENTESAFVYALSLEDVSTSGGKGLCWPLVDNNNIISAQRFKVAGQSLNDKVMYLEPWNSTFNSARVYLNERNGSVITVDGTPNEEFWNNEEERITVDSTTGTWGKLPSGTAELFDYSYRVYTGREYIYGAAVVGSEFDGDDKFTLWIKNDASATAATHIYDFSIDEYGYPVCKERKTGNTISFTVDYQSTKQGSSTVYTSANGGFGITAVDGKTYLEFMLDLDEFDSERDGYEYCVSVTCGGNTLFHPDNSDVASSTETLWITNFNEIVNGGGVVITDVNSTPASDDGVQQPISIADAGYQYWSRASFVPTEYEGIYKVTGHISGSAGINELTLALDEPDEFIICIQVGNPQGNHGTGAYSGLNYNCLAVTAFNSICSANVGGYVRLTGIDLENQTINTLYDDQWNSHVPFYEYGYATDATITAVTLGGERTGSFPETAWDPACAEAITAMGYFVPETIEVDGIIDDYGWDEDRWIEVVDNANGNLRNEMYLGCTELDYKYQLRVDDDYVYLAAVINAVPEVGAFQYVDADGNVKIYEDSFPYFRIWIQSQNEKYADAVSFTHLFNVRPGTTTLSVVDSTEELIADYEEKYHPVEGVEETHVGADDTISVVYDVASGSVSYSGAAIRAAEHLNYNHPNGGRAREDGTATVKNWNYDDSEFFGYTSVDAENTVSGVDVAYQNKWYARPDVEKYVYANEHAAYSASEDGQQMFVEFRFALEDIGCGNGEDFEYYVQASSEGVSETESYTLYHPPVVIESCTASADYDHYYLPHWVWGNTAYVVDAEARADLALRNPAEPVSPLGSQYIENYNYEGTDYLGLRFGVLYTAEHLDKTHNDGATYWDAKEIGMLIIDSNALSLNGNDVGLYTETAGVNYVESDAILNHVSGTVMSDYENYIFYAVALLPKGYETTKLSYRGFVEYYPSDDIYYDHWWLTGETNDKPGWTFRPTYYSNTLSRSFDMIKNATTADGVLPGERVDEPDLGVVNANGTKVAYIPLDNRPVNLARVEMLAEATGIDLITPPESYFSNTLNNDADTTTDCSDQGNPKDLLKWLKEIEQTEGTINYYVISLDQIFSGGLVGSRDPYSDTDGDSIVNRSCTPGNYTLSADEIAIADYLIDLAETKHVVYFDTVMRLATTNNYGSADMAAYDIFRESFANAARKQYYGSELTIGRIAEGYWYDANGNAISVASDMQTIANNYVLARERKLKLADYLYASGVENIERLYIGIDDSKANINIQTNETRYITERLIAGYDNASLFTGADELGLMGIAAVVTHLYGKVTVNVEYFGNGKNLVADAYDPGTLDESIKAHATAIGGKYTANGKTDIDVLVLTRSDYANLAPGSKDSAVHTANVNALVERIKKNLENDVPTCVIDGSGYDGYGTLSSALIAAELPVGELLGYSQWNTTSNATGIALSNALARYSYIKNNSANVTKDSSVAALKSISYSFIKDIAYKLQPGTAYADSSAFFAVADTIIPLLDKSTVFVGANDDGTYNLVDIGDIMVSNLHFPWNRDFEAHFNTWVLANGGGNIANTTTYDIPGQTVNTNFSADDSILTDGIAFAYTEEQTYKGWFGLYCGGTASDNVGAGGIAVMPMELPEETFIAGARLHFLHYQYGIAKPDKVTVLVSDDGVSYTEIKSVVVDESTDWRDFWVEVQFDRGVSAKYVRIDIDVSSAWTAIDEIEIYAAP